MATLGVVSASFAVLSGVAKATLAISHFVREFREAEDDLDAVSSELQALSNVLHPLAQSMSSPTGNLPNGFVDQVESTMKGCNLVIEQIRETIEKYSQENGWTKAKWVTFGKSDVLKLRDSLEAYKMALSIGLHAISINITREIKDETNVIRAHVEELRINTDEILERVDAIRQMGAPHGSDNKRVMEWMEDIALLSTYAESTYKPSEVDAIEFMKDQQSPVLSPVKEEPEQQELPTPPPDDLHHLPISVITDSTQWLDSDVTETPATCVEKGLEIPSRSNSVPRNSLGPKRPSLTDLKRKSTSDLKKIDHESTREATDPSTPLVHLKIPPYTVQGLSYKGIEDFADKVKGIASRVCRDDELITKSIARRNHLSEARRRQLDAELGKINSNTTAEWVKSIVAKGANPNCYWAQTRVSDSIKAALNCNNNECLYALLQCGANPNSEVDFTETHYSSVNVSTSSRHTALSHATWRANETAAWALCAAGAKVNPQQTRVSCIPFNNGGPGTCSSPLLRAICPKHQPPSFYSVRMTQFLLANGANPNHLGCDIFDNTHRISTPLSGAILYWTSYGSSSVATSLVEALIAGGAKVNLSHIPAKSAMDTTNNPYHIAAYYGRSKILSAIAGSTENTSPSLWTRAICIAARNDTWDCVKVLATQPYLRKDHLHYLVKDYMHWQSMSWSQFSRAASLLIADEANPLYRTSVSYVKKGFLSTSQVVEDVSAIELAENIESKVSRRQVVKLLTGRFA